MKKSTKYISYLLLVFYAAYAFSPLYASSTDAEYGGQEKQNRATSYTVGILWLDVVLDEIVGNSETDPARETISSADDEDIVFLKKKRVVNRHRFALNPIIKIEAPFLPRYDDDVPEVSYRSYDISRDPIHQHADGYYALSTGLSPPFFLS